MRRTVAPGASAAVAHRIAPGLIGSPDAAERPITVDQTNHSVVVDEAVIVKWLHSPCPGPHRGVMLMEHLSEVGFADMPAFLGAHVSGRQVLAVLTGHLAGARDGWEWYVDLLTEDLDAGHPTRSLRSAVELGALTGRLHHALATRSSVIDQPVGWAGAGAEHARAVALLETALAVTDGEAGRRLAGRAAPIRRAIDALASAGSVEVQHIHGDLHVGQVLRWRDRLVVIDFDGNPVDGPGHDARRSPMVDLASIVQSVDHVGRVVARRRPDLEPAVADFIAEATAAVVSSYGRLGPVDTELFTALRTAQELHELVYAHRHLPRWRYVPEAALAALHP